MNAADLTTGSVVDRYTVRNVLGEGGMAIVYLVEHNQLGSMHALKVLTIASRQIKERLLLEGRAQATLRHPNVVTVTDVVDIGGSPGLVMEYIEGPSLDDFLENQKLSVEQVDHLAQGILAGVAAAHNAGLVHRDLKPANIMLSIATGGLQPKVTDFGLAKIVATDGSQSKTRTGSTMGTPHYMSPEQIDDAKNVGAGTDIWALGAIFYEMLAGGRRAFPGDNLLAIFSAVNKGEYTPLSELAPEAPERMVRAIEAALSRNLDERPASVADLYAIWAGDAAAAAQAPMGPWDAGAMAHARSIASGVGSQPAPGSDETFADVAEIANTHTDSMLTSRAAWIGVGGGLLGIGGILVAVLALGLGGVGLWYWSTLEPEVQTVERIVEKVVEVPVAVPGEPAPADAGTAAAAPAPAPQAGAAATKAPPKDPTPADPAPAVAEAEEPLGEDEPPEAPEPPPVAPEPAVEPKPPEEAVDTAAPAEEAPAVAEVEPPSAAEDERAGYMGLLLHPDPEERIASIKRQEASADDDTSRRFLEVIKTDQNSKVKKTALDACIRMWDASQGHWATNRDAMTYAMGLSATYAVSAADAYGRNGEDPHGLLPGLRHSDVAVRRAAIDALGRVLPKAPADFDRRGFVEPYTEDSDSTVSKKARKIVSDL